MNKYVTSRSKKIMGKQLLRIYKGWTKGFLHSPSKSYSQYGEDLVVYNYFGAEKTEEFHVDIGCFHPKQIPNSYIFHKQGRKGLAVDIDKHKTDLFTALRKGRCDVMVAAATGPNSLGNTSDVYLFQNGWSEIDTLDKESAIYQRDIQKRGEFTVDKINTIGINQLLDKLPHINLLNIDAEGIDIDIMQHIDLTRFQIDVTLFEDNKKWGGPDFINEKMPRHGYKLLFCSKGSVCFAKAKIQHNEVNFCKSLALQIATIDNFLARKTYS